MNGKMIYMALALATGLATTPAATAADAARGKMVFEIWCNGCHEPLPGRGIVPPAGSYTLRQRYGDKLPAALEQRTDLIPALIRMMVRNGLRVMPPFRKTEIPDADLEALVAYLVKTQ
jgi:(+)-pinoresinol hydroxylase